MKKIKKGFFDYVLYAQEKVILAKVLMGHLVIENLLVESIKTQLKFPDEFDPYSLPFPKKVELCVSQGIVAPHQKSVYLKLNKIRNNYAHQLNYELTFDEAFEYVKEVASAGFEFSDYTIFDDKKLSEEWYGIEGIIDEIVGNISIELIVFLHDHGVDIPQ